MAGETGAISVSMPLAMVIAGFFTVAMYNTIEILIWIFSIFKHWRGLYFWSLLVASFGIPVHSVAVLFRFFNIAPDLPMSVVICIGWWAMVTGQSVVLYSRLHLIVCDLTKVKWVLTMIIVNFCIMHIPVTILFVASSSGHPEPYLSIFNVYEKVQLAVFSLQESIISGMYLWEATHGLKPILDIKGADGKAMIRNLCLLFIAVVVLDISLMTSEYINYFQIQTTYKPVVYSIKLKIEFVILNKLLAFTRMGTCHCHHIKSDPARDLSHPSATGTVSTDRTRVAGRYSSVETGPKRTTDHIFDGRFEPSAAPGDEDLGRSTTVSLALVSEGTVYKKC